MAECDPILDSEGNFGDLASWGSSLDPARIASIQKAGAGQVIQEDCIQNIKWIVGLDVGYRKRSQAIGAAVAYDYPSLEAVESVLAEGIVAFPYKPGALAFREIPLLLKALQLLSNAPDLIVCDAHGIAHPRGFGMASQLGVMLDCPTIGCAKSLLVGVHEPVPNSRGAWSPLYNGGQRIGAAVRTQKDVRPVYVSIGHKLCLETAIRIVLECSLRFRLPEPIRHAHNLASQIGKG